MLDKTYLEGTYFVPLQQFHFSCPKWHGSGDQVHRLAASCAYGMVNKFHRAQIISMAAS